MPSLLRVGTGCDVATSDATGKPLPYVTQKLPDFFGAGDRGEMLGLGHDDRAAQVASASYFARPVAMP
jgi:hypothetical protein